MMNQIEESWKDQLQDEFEKDYFKDLSDFVEQEYSQKMIYPPKNSVFAAFEACSFNNVRVVILGQDPYHGPDQANGLSFSVNSGMKTPPSLRNIFKEIQSDLGIDTTQDTDLTRWAKQGVLLLNATLTVQAKTPGSHQKKGWEEFTDRVIKELSENKKQLVFILWGAYAKKKGSVIDSSKHCIINSAHPSPFSAYRGFFGSKPFSKTNDYLLKTEQLPIDWS
jgi:uracil-DNA glycosylase